MRDVISYETLNKQMLLHDRLEILSRNLFACLQEVISSFRLLSEARLGLQII